MQPFFSALEHSMRHEHLAVASNANPVALKADELGAAALAYLLEQYSVFPSEIANLLNTARRTLSAWTAVQDALIVNVEEEEGSRTDGISHYELLRSGVLQEYGFDIERVQAQKATRDFLTRSQAALMRQHPAFVAGATYAIEASSSGEIEIVQELANRLSMFLNGRSLPAESQLQVFFQSHLEDFEVGHEEELRAALSPLLDKANEDIFKHGFNEILLAMDAWWVGLEKETELRLIAA